MGKKPKKSSSGFPVDTIFPIIALVAFIVLAGVFVYTALSTKMLTPPFIAALVAVVALPIILVMWLSLSRSKPIRRAVGFVLAMVFCLVFAAGTRYIQIALNTLNRITSAGSETSAMTVYVRGDDERGMEELLHETFGILSNDGENTQAAVAQLNQEHNTTLETRSYSSAAELVDALQEGEVEAILADQGHLSVLQDLEGYETALSDLREVKSFHVTLKSDNTPAPSDNVSASDTVFTVYISGSDSRESNIMATGRSDVNILATVNTKTRQVLLLSTPRDYYVPLSTAGKNDLPDKLTHAGLYGVDVSMDTLANLYDTPIDYYFRVNFTGFEDIIDALGGIEVDSQYAFSSTISERPISYKKGINQLDGYEALYYVRERYAFANGDYQRGINQMQVIEAVMRKAMSPAILTSYTSMMDAVSNCFKTSVPSDLISSLVRDQLAGGGEWNVVSYYVSGTGSSEYTYSVPNQKSYVTIPDDTTIDTAKRLMEQVRNGETITAPETE